MCRVFARPNKIASHNKSANPLCELDTPQLELTPAVNATSDATINSFLIFIYVAYQSHPSQAEYHVLETSMPVRTIKIVDNPAA